MDDSNRVNGALRRIGRTAATNRRAVFVVVALLVGISAVGMAGLQMSLGMELYLEDDSQTIQDWEEIQEDFNKGNVVFIELAADEQTDLYEPENTQKIADLYQSYYERVDSAALVTSFAHPIIAGVGEVPDTKSEVLHSVNHTFNDHRSNMGVIGNIHPDITETEQYERAQQSLEAEEYPVSVPNGTEMFDGGQTAMIMVQYGDVDIPEDRDGEFFGFLPPSEDEIVEEQLRAATAEADLPEGVDVTFTGSPVFEEAAFGLMLPEMITLFTIAFGIILTLVVVVMRGRLRKTRRVGLPLTMALVALIAMLGMMGFVGFAFNAIMLGVMPVALGLGIDYGLQIQTRYVEERTNGRTPVDAAGIASQTTGRALALALGTTLVGLGSLLAAEVPPVRQFGVTAAFSVLVAMGLSITFLIALLVQFDDAPDATSTRAGAPAVETSSGGAGSPTGLEAAFDAVGRAVSARPLLVVVLLGGLIVGGAAAYPAVDTRTDMLDYWPDIEERQDIRDLESDVPSPNINYVIVESDDAYTYETFEQLQGYQHELENHDDIITVMSPVRALEVGQSSVPVGGQTTDTLPPEDTFEERLAFREQVDRPPQLGTPRDAHPDRLIVQVFVEDVNGEQEREVIDYINEVGDRELPSEVDTRVTGEMVLNRNVIENVTSGLTRTTLVSFALGALFLGIVLRSSRESVLLIGSVAGSALALTAGGMWLLGVPWNPLTVTTAAIILGVGITYGIHIYERFREEVTVDGTSPSNAVRTAIVRKSRPVLGSGATTMFGFGVLAISDFPVLSNFGFAIAIAMAMALLTAFVFMPAITVILARRNLLPAGEDTA